MSLITTLLLTACVVRYGPEPEAGVDAAIGEPVPAEATRSKRPDYNGMEKEILTLLEADVDPDADRSARLHAAQELTLAMRSPRADPDAAVEAYLRQLIEIESRGGRGAEVAFVGDGPLIAPGIEEEELEAPEPVPEEAPEETPEEVPEEVPEEPVDAEEALASAREALSEQRYKDAVDALAPARGDEAPSELEALWLEAVDGWVHQERERAGEMFIDARALPAESRDAALGEVEALLAGLLTDFPDNSYVDAIERNLGLVREARQK